jgi:hypothetical protein
MWLQDTANLLKVGALEKLDIPNLIEEIESMGRSEKNALKVTSSWCCCICSSTLINQNGVQIAGLIPLLSSASELKLSLNLALALSHTLKKSTAVVTARLGD